MPPLASIQLRPPKILLWGDPGSGKTPFVTSFGEGLQILDCDDGLRSSLTLNDRWKSERLKVDVKQFLELDPNKALAFAALKSEILSIYNQCNAKTYPFKVLAIDSFTALASFAIRYIAGNSNVLNNQAKMTQQMWGIAIGEIENLFVWLKALPIPVVVIFHSREGSDGELATKELAIFGKNLPSSIISYFDEVLRVKVRTINGSMQPYLQTQSDATSVARSRMALKNGTLTEIGFRELLSQMNWKV